MTQREVKKLRKALEAVEAEVLQQYPGLKEWTEPAKRLVHAQAVVQYLSGKLPAACQDKVFWRALLHGEREAFAKIDTPRSNPIPSRLHYDGKAIVPTVSDHDHANQVMQKALSIIQVGHNKQQNKSHIRAQLKQLAGEHERIPPRDGKAAFRGSLRGALIYLLPSRIEPFGAPLR
jgi:hypothetical protein